MADRKISGLDPLPDTSRAESDLLHIVGGDPSGTRVNYNVTVSDFFDGVNANTSFAPNRTVTIHDSGNLVLSTKATLPTVGDLDVGTIFHHRMGNVDWLYVKTNDTPDTFKRVMLSTI